MNDREVLEALYATVENRRDNPKEGSYTCYLLDKGIDKILKKVGEECSETIIAAFRLKMFLPNLKKEAKRQETLKSFMLLTKIHN